MTVGEKIREKRLEKGLTQKALGEIVGIAEPTIRRYETGKLNPKIETIRKIADGLKITPFDLIGPEWFDFQLDPQKLSDLQNEITTYQALEQYLKSLGYIVSFDGSANTDDPDVVLIKGKEKTIFTGEQFKEFEKAIAASVEYQIWQQRHLKT